MQHRGFLWVKSSTEMRKTAAPRYSGKIQKTTATIFPLNKNSLQLRSFETHCQQPASLNWGGERKGSLTYMKWVFSRQTIVVRRRERGGRQGRDSKRWRFAFMLSLKNSSTCTWTFITLVNTMQTVRDFSDPCYVKALTHADYSGGHLPLKHGTVFQGEHTPHMWSCLMVWRSHMLLIEENIWVLTGCRCIISC